MQVSRFVAVAVVALVVAGSAPVVGQSTAGETTTQDQVTITVHVINAVGSDVGNAEVTASWDGGSTSATTRSNGQALLDVPDGARVEVSVDHPDYTRNDAYVISSASGETHDVRVYSAGSLTVTVVEEGEPVEGATVTLSKEDRAGTAAEGTTGADGQFTAEDIEEGTYTASVVKPGYARNGTEVEVIGGSEATVAIEQAVVTYEVTVVDDHFDEPRKVKGATVEYDGVTSGRIETGGSATTNLPLQVNADYTVTVTKDGYEATQRTVSVGESGGELRFAINREDELLLEPDNREVLVGNRVDLTVTDEYGDPVEGATITLDGDAVGQTNAEGVYRVSIDSEGNHTITAEKDGVTSTEVVVSGVSTDAEDAPTTTAAATDTATATQAGTDAPELSLQQPRLLVQVGVAAVGVLLAFLVVRRLL